ncbi:uncharacterized protein BCR38DRAFT_451084 [Pseudomassariella vexata]|uniref:Siderophore biosynthesis enzyme n=1 Tax=Pseudomassariella vexata TaxID=1141098 RepID=A0A1Y2DAP2_9PEZI|nr:uncharacterized protein BCR38DRAFT_451084 [Pseudomassariella vexata]ORY56340.1 hypothetical protein BCR38DRAFT_451084 [Pseudomassariella vexata]
MFTKSQIPVLVAALLATPITAKTDLSGCTSSETVTYGGASMIWYVPGTGEICAFLDCGGGRAPAKTTVPGCPQYSGTASYAPSFLPGFGGDSVPATATTTEETKTPTATSAGGVKSSGAVSDTLMVTIPTITATIDSTSDLVLHTTFSTGTLSQGGFSNETVVSGVATKTGTSTALATETASVAKSGTASASASGSAAATGAGPVVTAGPLGLIFGLVAGVAAMV